MKKFLIGFDVGATNIKAGLINTSECRVVYTSSLATKHYIRKKYDLISAFIELVYSILDRSKLSKKEILGIGFGLPGPIDSRKGKVHFLPNIPGWKEVPLKKILENKLKVPIFVDNDVNLITLAEWKKGAGVGINNLLCMTLGTGVGGGLVLDNKLYRGAHFLAGEIGHTPINENGPVCNCGGRACLERYIGNKYILVEAKKSFKDRQMTLEKLSLLAKRGNKRAEKIWQDVGRRLGVGICGAVNLLNLEMVIIGGGVSLAGAPLFKSIRKTVKLRAMPTHARQVKIVKSRLGNNAGIIGAAILAKEKI